MLVQVTTHSGHASSSSCLLAIVEGMEYTHIIFCHGAGNVGTKPVELNIE